ncbi:MAG: YihA family ribosome biogenesis GTP-binding protein [Clostridia bacterium]|nr:YihA family ribosome biogenesis GTP-binding protein [Clostridia bacterium]
MNKHNVSLTISAGRRDQLIRDGRCQIAFSGRSNVGKSSALNRLLGRKSLARVSSSPGKTVTVNFFDLDGACYLVDLPGYGFARRSEAEKRAWSSLTDAYFCRHEDLALVLQLVDLKTGPSKDDRMMISFLREVGIPFVVVATKLDKLNKTNREKNLSALEEEVFPTPVFPFSSLSGEGADRVWSIIENAVEAFSAERNS